MQTLRASDCETLRYSRVFMSLFDILSGRFFTEYIKVGNIIMRSSGRHLVDNLYHLHDGILHLELDRPTYERCGLVGEPISDGGRKHAKQRFLVKLNLRPPNMLHGKKGFERLMKAAKEVLIGDEEWLFVDLEPGNGEGERPIDNFHPTLREVKPTITNMEHGQLTRLPDDRTAIEDEYAEALIEWLGLIWIDSPRLNQGDDIDPFLCRYQSPQRPGPERDDGGAVTKSTKIVHMRWHGFVNQKFMKEMFSAIEHVLTGDQSWIAINVCGFKPISYSTMGISGRQWLSWHCEG